MKSRTFVSLLPADADITAQVTVSENVIQDNVFGNTWYVWLLPSQSKPEFCAFTALCSQIREFIYYLHNQVLV